MLPGDDQIESFHIDHTFLDQMNTFAHQGSLQPVSDKTGDLFSG